MKLNPSDRENGLVIQGSKNSRQHALRKGGAQWVGVRADFGVVNSGRWAYCVWNESGGNLRVGWSCSDATLRLGTDQWSWGYGGTATKSHGDKFEKYGQTYGKGDAITCLLDLDRRAITYMKNGREIPGDAFQLGRDIISWPLFPHIYTKEATFSVSFDGSGGAPPLQSGFTWIASAGRVMIPSPKKPPKGWSGADPGESCESAKSSSGKPTMVLTAYGWRSEDSAEGKAGVGTQEWRTALDAYVRHFTLLLEAEYEAERQEVIERVKRRTITQLQADGNGVGGLQANFDEESGRIVLWSEHGWLPHLQEISRGRTVLLSTMEAGLDLDDATKTISGEVESVMNGEIILSTQYERIPAPRSVRGRVTYRVDLGPNIIAYKRIDRMLDELQRCLGTAQAKAPRGGIEKLNHNSNLSGLLLPGGKLANALFADIAESSAAAIKWDPMSRPRPLPDADISKAARAKAIGAPPYVVKGVAPTLTPKPNDSQQEAMNLVVDRHHCFSLIQGPPGTGKTTTAVAIICGWLRTKKGPILASAFSNRGTDNLAEALHKRGVRVLRMGLCPQEMPYSLETRLAEAGERRGDKGIRKVMETVDVVCATCIGCGMGPLDKIKFPYVIVDEAAQVIEPAVVLPLGKGAVQAVMVGDQCQLPATVLSQEAQNGGLDIAMFDRLLSMGMEVQLLNKQYRMHPQICEFPSWRFYRSDLLSAVLDSQRTLPPRLPFKAPLAFLHVDATEMSAGSSKKNSKEAACVAWLVETITQSLPVRLKGDEIGIITPYSAQVSEIRNALPPHLKASVQVASVDAFQGCEKEYIIFSLVRANPRADVGFVADWRRINVALTRAKRFCALVGHLPTWLDAQSALVRDWVGYHSLASAGLYCYQSRSITSLSDALDRRVQVLRKEFTDKKVEASKLPRISVAARDSTAGSKSKLWTLEKAVIDALQSKNEEALSKALARASEAGVMNSTIEEAEQALVKMTALKELNSALALEDELSIRVALDTARECDIDEATIKKAEEALNRMLVGKELADALGLESESLLELALPQASEAGVERAKIKEAEHMLRRLVAARELDNAVSSDASADDFEAVLNKAIQNARIAAVPPASIRAAEVRLKEVRSLNASHDVLIASAGEDKDVLKAALEKAKAVGVASDDIVAADAHLQVLTATDALQSADTAATLHLALAVAQQAGVSAELIARSEKKLRDLATEALGEAVSAGRVGDLRANIAIARDATVDVGVIVAAEATLSRVVSENALVEAVETGSEAALRAALEAAEEHGVEDVFLDAAKQKIRRFEAAQELQDAQELVAALEIAGAVTEEDEASLEKAVAEARESGVEEKLISEASILLNRNAAMRRLSCTKDGPLDQLTSAIVYAKEAGLHGPVVDDAEARLRQLAASAGMEAASEALTQAVNSQDFVALGVAIAAAKANHVDPALIAEAEQLSATLACDDIYMWAADMEPVDASLPAAKRQKTSSGIDSETLQRFAICLVEIALLSCRKRQAVETEDFGLAHELKLQEVHASERLQGAKTAFLGSLDTSACTVNPDATDVTAKMDELEQQKKKAVEEEDFHRAAQIKELQAELLKSGTGVFDDACRVSKVVEINCELERVRAEKKAAVDAEEFGRASTLRKRELELERNLQELDGRSSSSSSSPEVKARKHAVALVENDLENVQIALQSQGSPLPIVKCAATLRHPILAELRKGLES